ncbi:amidohydrolase [Deinococcus yavapaiensis]|uniref:Amidohydrolase 3 domain-containing protein n=1 Tax=Deinococcus yavapaiensis KR-236 TaxID=694435 RepID=A0A318SBR1_9DEIO|nr:amidohydrolase [Deinococcus yavapaiensis]PYE55794.1 hypothetical protein DES52_102159 [Deinococcus yavapaiensis KR-236]
MLQLILSRILTQDAARPNAEAVLVGGGRVLAVGSREEMTAVAPKADVLDHRDSFLTPGLVDAHTHLVGYGFSLSQVDLTGSRGVSEVVARLRERAAVTPHGEWIQGGGFLFSELGLADYPTARELDEATPHHPVIAFSRDLHSAWVNSEALRRAGISEATPDPEGGRIVRPLGTLLEYAKEIVRNAIPAPTHREYEAAASRGARDLQARGFTGTHTMGFEPPEALAAMLSLAARNALPLRVWSCVDHDRLEYVRALGLRGNVRGQLTIGGIKFFADGALGSRTAWLYAPGFADGSGTGLPLHSPELILERGREALELGFVPVTHAIGDRANTEVLDVYERLALLAREKGMRLRLEHAQHLRREDVARFGRLGVTASVQPIHLLGDGPMIRALLPHLENTTYAFASLLRSGALLALGSDAPVAPPNVQDNFRAALTRRDDTGEFVAPDETLTVEETLFAYTRGPALAVGWDDVGIVREGAVAEFTLWDEIGGNAASLVL